VYGGASDRLFATVTNRQELVAFSDACRDIQPFFWNAPDIDVVDEWSVCVNRTNHPYPYEFKAYVVREPASHIVGLIHERYGDGKSWRYYGHFSSKQMYQWFVSLRQRCVTSAGPPGYIGRQDKGVTHEE